MIFIVFLFVQHDQHDDQDEDQDEPLEQTLDMHYLDYCVYRKGQKP